MSKSALGTNNIDAFWMPFTANRQFKQNPRLLVGAKDMHYKSHDGREILDGTAGLWCCNAGHARPKIVEAVQKQVAELDYAPAFQMGHPKVFELAARLAAMLPSPIDHVFFTNSGSESVDTALKIALAYHRAKGNGTKVKLIGRERGYHGVGFGGISVGGISGNRKAFGNALGGIDHIRHTHDVARNAFTRGEPEYGAEFADDLERVIALHDASNIAAVIVEPVAGSTGVLIPPKGYLQRLREICTKHDILLIFDEVITGFGRLGTPFAVDYFGVVPDLVTTAKGITSGVIPMGAVFATRQIYEAFMTGPEHMIELFHGYTYSGHPIACAAALATLDTYEEEGLMTRASDLSEYWADALHALKGLPHVIDIRNLGLIGAIELQPIDGAPTKRAFQAFLDAYEKGLLIRTTGDIIALSPPLIISKGQIEHLFDTLADVLKNLA
ncbi:aspartate aminotransferase family protein [Phyllobacterium brassicacearum]|uniref:Aspartate aminotransferase family protein n=1 Tax=Phyllobacterium brassicacearum TaxID=314235 RepID=A0A2P7BK01_9HYPH|nr:aspartate aminotransferase family protein [Phyllobacterium brassicacearum]PSH66755.1 aspartate aminotransferase family protein [Phyllobacterium brassicacearum]TDQ32081.1 beta-alanine--pyruvate transaminase [Phyllobacterium brassicacearum]